MECAHKTIGLSAAAALILLLGCTAAVESPDGATGAGGNATAGAGGSRATGGTSGVAAASLPMRLLTRVEYNNSVFDLLGDDSRPADGFPSEAAGDTGFAQVQKLDDVNVNAYLQAAETVATRATVDVKKRLGCDPSGDGEATCLSSFIRSFGRRAYRRPLSDGEVEQHLVFYRDQLRGALKLSVEAAVRALLATMLQSPFFLYRWENGGQATRDDRALRLNPHHLAAQLSYFLWASMPDDELFAAADRDALGTRAEIETQVRRMLRDPRAERSVAAFAEQWLGVVALPSVLRAKAGWGPALAEAMRAEVQRFASDVVLRGDGRVETLFTSRRTSVDGTLAAFYGQADITGALPQPLTFEDGERAGILTLAGVMAAHADENEPSPILRGKFVREHVMCDVIPPPPPGGVPDLPPPSPDVTKKERFAKHGQGACKSCHELMDPIGFAFEHYDNVGAYRTMDGKFAVDSQGTATNLDGEDRAFASAIELTGLLGKSDQVRDCLLRQFFRYGLARKEEDVDEPALEAVRAAFRASDNDVREMLVALVTSRALTHRAPSAGETLP